MKKILMGILIFFLLLIITFMLIGRVGFGEFRISGLENIKEESDKLDKKILEVSALTKSTYEQKKDDLNSAQKSMLKSKQDYKEKLAYSTAGAIESANRLENYNIDFLWTRIGKYATKQGLGLKLELQSGSTQELKNLVFTATGKYIPITDFIYSIEEDDELNFTIEDFKLIADNKEGTILQASFTVPDVAMNLSNLKTSTTTNTSTTTQGTDENTTTTNTTENNTTTNNTTTNNTTTNSTVTNNT